MTKYIKLDKNNVAVLFVDHQSGLFNICGNTPPHEFQDAIFAMADTAKFFNLPVILTTSFETGPNGPKLQKLKEMFPNAPFISRPGQINAWDNDDFVKAVKATGKKQLIISGIATDVCVAFPALSALEAGYEVFIATDASGTFNKDIHLAALLRMGFAGAQLMNWFSIAAELRRDWRGENLAGTDITEYGELLTKHLPSYQSIVESYNSSSNS